MDKKVPFSWIAGLAIIFIIMCFIPCRHAVADWFYGYDNDNYRDMSNVNNILAGQYSADPSYLGEYRWYNPLLYWIEAFIIKIYGTPIHIIISQGGPYLNLIVPVCFFLMMFILFDGLVALAALTGFLFFISNDMPGYFSATYTPWLYPVTFVQFGFYLSLIALYYAFIKEKISSFAILGFAIGIVFLGHTAPALILILQTFWLTVNAIRNRLVKKSETTLAKILFTRSTAALTFIITSLPLTIFVYGKYKFHLVNNPTYEYAEPIFQLRNIPELIISNLSTSFFVALAGFYFLIRNKQRPVINHIIYSWLFFSNALYFYITIAKYIQFHYGLELPGFVPSFHFFFYAKAAESVLFGYGFVEIMKRILKYLSGKISLLSGILINKPAQVMLLLLVFLVAVNYNGYLNRGDFYCTPAHNYDDASKDKIEVYHWLMDKTSINQVMLCQDDLICFPLLASGRKMVACTQDHTNPYINFKKRFNDRERMMEILQGKKDGNQRLFSEYKVDYVLVVNSDSYPRITDYFPKKVYTCKTYSVYSREDRNTASNQND